MSLPTIQNPFAPAQPTFEDEMCSMCPSMTYQQRLIGFCICCGCGYAGRAGAAPAATPAPAAAGGTRRGMPVVRPRAKHRRARGRYFLPHPQPNRHPHPSAYAAD